MDEEKTELKEAVSRLILATLVQLPVTLFIKGFTLAFMWNNLLVSVFGLKPITVVAGVSIHFFITYITGYATSQDYYNKSGLEKLLIQLFRSALIILITIILSIFL